MHVVVVGAGLAGVRTIEALRGLGFSGAISLYGAEPEFPYDRPALSKQILSGDKTIEDLWLLTPERARDLDVDVHLGTRALELDLASSSVLLHSGVRVDYDHLVVATGASPRELPAMPSLDGLFTLRTIADASAIRARLRTDTPLVVVGAGFIGSEVAATARSMGCDVTVLETAPAPLMRGLGSDLGMVMGHLHADHGTTLVCGVTITDFEGRTNVEAVRLHDGRVVPAGLVVVGVGAVPATAWLEGSGVLLADGLVCDASCRALGTDNVWAVGDIARWPNPLFDEEMRLEHWTNAGEQATNVAHGILGDPRPYAPVPYVWSDQYGHRIQIVGRTQGADEVAIVCGSAAERSFLACYRRGDLLVGAVALDAPKLLAGARRQLMRRASWLDAVASLRS